MMNLDNNRFVFVIKPSGERALINTSSITNIREDNTAFNGVPAVLCDILGRSKSVVLYAGVDAADYFDWLNYELGVLNYNEHSHDEEE